MKPTMMLEKHFTNKFSAIINLHQTMNVCVIDLKLVQGGFLVKSRMMSVNVVNSYFSTVCNSHRLPSEPGS